MTGYYFVCLHIALWCYVVAWFLPSFTFSLVGISKLLHFDMKKINAKILYQYSEILTVRGLSESGRTKPVSND